MTNINCMGLVLKTQPIGERDKRVTVLTDSIGLIHCFARGAQSIGGRLMSATQPFAYSAMTLFQRKESYSLDHADIEKLFMAVSIDIAKLSLVQYFAQAVIAHAPREEDARETLRLLLNCLHFLNGDQMEPAIVKVVFEFQLMKLCGYQPLLEECGSCGEQREEGLYFFSLSEGILRCEACAQTRREEECVLPPPILKALRHVSGDLSKAFFFQLPGEQLSYLGDIGERYLQYHSERRYETLDYYKSMNG